MSPDHNSGYPEESLDPQDWDELRSLGRQMIDDMLLIQEVIALGKGILDEGFIGNPR